MELTVNLLKLNKKINKEKKMADLPTLTFLC